MFITPHAGPGGSSVGMAGSGLGSRLCHGAVWEEAETSGSRCMRPREQQLLGPGLGSFWPSLLRSARCFGHVCTSMICMLQPAQLTSMYNPRWGPLCCVNVALTAPPASGLCSLLRMDHDHDTGRMALNRKLMTPPPTPYSHSPEGPRTGMLLGWRGEVA